MQQTKVLNSLTLKPNVGILRVLITKVNIVNSGTNMAATVNAIWDTGATGSVITSKVVQALKLIPTGMAQVHTANGQANQRTYTVDIALPNQVLIQKVNVTEVPGLSSGCEALLGMDIISLGDFSITNHNGQTCMSFRVPSSHEIDYVKNPTYGVTAIKNIAPGTPGSNITPPKKKRKK